jgi:hypothetical protein
MKRTKQKITVLLDAKNFKRKKLLEAKKLKRIFQLKTRNASEIDLFSLCFTPKRFFFAKLTHAGVSIMQALPLMKIIFA